MDQIQDLKDALSTAKGETPLDQAEQHQRQEEILQLLR